MSGPTQVDVVVLTWNDGALLDRALASAVASEGVVVGVTVVDNGSEPPARVDDPRVQVLRNETNEGVAPGRAQGIAIGSAPYVLLLDSDAELGPRALARMMDVIEGDPEIALVGPVFEAQRPEESGGRAPTFGVKLARGLGWRDDYRPGRLLADGNRDVEFVIGACQLFRRDAYEQVGGLDTSIFYGPEDVDLCLRMKAAGWRIVQAGGVGCHHPPRRRNRRLMSRAGLRHAHQVARYVVRSRPARVRNAS
jgi:GT2 family glycosyltransferase